MKTKPILCLLAGLALLAGCASQSATAPKTPANVTVTFQDPDKFTDVRDTGDTFNSHAYLDELHDYLLNTASAAIGADQKLTITVTDIDLAGENLFNPACIRVLKGTSLPRVALSFQLLGAGGKVVKEGERRLTNINYMDDSPPIGDNKPLYYDKLLLKRWVQDEFGAKS